MADTPTIPDDPSGIGGHIATMRQSVRDMLYNHPVLGSVLALARAVDTPGKSAAAPAAVAAPASLSDDLPAVKDIALPLAKPIELPIDRPTADKPLGKPKAFTTTRTMRGGRR